MTPLQLSSMALKQSSGPVGVQPCRSVVPSGATRLVGTTESAAVECAGATGRHAHTSARAAAEKDEYGIQNGNGNAERSTTRPRSTFPFSVPYSVFVFFPRRPRYRGAPATPPNPGGGPPGACCCFCAFGDSGTDSTAVFGFMTSKNAWCAISPSG